MSYHSKEKLEPVTSSELMEICDREIYVNLYLQKKRSNIMEER
jgi:hypothetical protein